MPAPYNLPVPPYTFVSDTTIRIGENPAAPPGISARSANSKRRCASSGNETQAAIAAWAVPPVAAGDHRRHHHRLWRGAVSGTDRNYPQRRLPRIVRDRYDASVFTPPGPWGAFIIIVPVIGGLIVTYLITNFAPEARGHGVPEVMDAIYYKEA